MAYVSVDYLLSPEIEAPKCVLSERMPQDCLLQSHLLAQNSCALELLATDKLVAAYLHPSPGPSPFWRGESNIRHSNLQASPPLSCWSPSPEGRGARGEVLHFALPV